MSGEATQGFAAHVSQDLTTLCRAWAILRNDGQRLGFTDHDMPLTFDGLTFRADTGLTSSALQRTSGLAVDNSETVGAISDVSLNEADIAAGRFDGAEVVSWLVNWANVEDRQIQFRGSIGELRRAGGAFHAELRGLTETLNKPLGRVYQKPCTSVLGDTACGFDVTQLGFFSIFDVETVAHNRRFEWDALLGFEDGWFARGRLSVLSGAASGLSALIKTDATVEGRRIIELWEPLRAAVLEGDQVRLDAGCDKRSETCRSKFDNLTNYQGFPDIPGDDWMVAYPKSSNPNTGGSRR